MLITPPLPSFSRWGKGTIERASFLTKMEKPYFSIYVKRRQKLRTHLDKQNWYVAEGNIPDLLV